MPHIWNSYNPSTGSVVNTFTTIEPEIIHQKMNEAVSVQAEWENTLISERADLIIRFGQHLKTQRKNLAEMMAIEMGKPVTQGLAEVDKCVQTCDYYAEHGPSFLTSEEIHAHYHRTWVVKRPLGVILAIMPWNFPLWQVIRCAIPAILSGNTIVLKHAPSVQNIALWLEKAFFEVFKMPVLIQMALENHHAEELIADPRVRGVSFTGSTQTGRKVAAIAGTFLKKSVLELGGSDPYIVLEDADIEKAIEVCVKSRFINGGQSCIAGKRFFVHAKVYSTFLEGVVAKVKNLKVGSPLDEKTEVGPLAEERFRIQIMEQLQNSVCRQESHPDSLQEPNSIQDSDSSLMQNSTILQNSSLMQNFIQRQQTSQELQGDAQFNPMRAQILCGGHIIAGAGFFMEPTVVECFVQDLPILQEETFGPLMPIMKFESESDVVRWANSTPYGLGGAVFSKDYERAWKIAVEKLQSGFIAINGMVSSDPRVPFGGVKNSGFGRELGSYGLHEFINLKSIGIN